MAWYLVKHRDNFTFTLRNQKEMPIAKAVFGSLQMETALANFFLRDSSLFAFRVKDFGYNRSRDNSVCIATGVGAEKRGSFLGRG
jgi:hypothetical protein